MDREHQRSSPGSELSRNDLASALASAGAGIWRWDLASGELTWTTEVYEIYGQSVDSFNVTFEAWLDCIHPEDRSDVRSTVAAALEEASCDFFVQHRLIRPKGQVRWTEGRGRCLFDADGKVVGMTGVATDVTARIEATQRAQNDEATLRLFAELASDYIYSVDIRTGQLVPNIVAGSFERTTGYTTDELAELGGWFAVIHPDDRASLEVVAEQAKSGAPFVSEYRILAKNGSIKWLRDRVRPIIDESTGKLIGMVGGVHDITDRKSLERQLLHAQKMEPLARLAGGVAHDFNNLLTVIISATQMIQAGVGTTADNLDDIMTAADRAADLTRSLLAFGRQDLGTPKPTRILDVLASATPLITRLVREQVHVQVHVQDETATVFADPTQLQMVLLNLAINARDAMPHGGTISITASTLEVDLDSNKAARTSAGSWVVLEVKDTGHGIPEEVLPHIFEPFFTTKPMGSGTGLGLATVHGIVHRMGGTISVSSELEVETTFTVYLPRATDVGKVSEVGDIGEVQATVTTSYTIGGTERVLLVEDEAPLRDLTTRYLEDLGYEITAVGSAEEALALPNDALASIKLLISDVRLPGTPGTQLAVLLADSHPSLKVLLISGFVEDEAQRAIIESNRFAFQRKPFAPETIARRLRELLD